MKNFFDGAEFKPESDFALYYRPEPHRNFAGVWKGVPVRTADGRFISNIPVNFLQQLSGRGWFECVLKHGEFRGLRVICKLNQFYPALADVSGRDLSKNGRAQERRDTEQACTSVCPSCRQRKDLSEFINGVVGKIDCRECDKKSRLRIATLDGQIRRAREIAAVGSHSEYQWHKVLKLYGRRCLRCGTKDDVTKDHIQPLVSGGSNDIENIQPLCRPCNSWKGSRAIDFRDAHFLKEHSQIPAFPNVPGGHPLGKRERHCADGREIWTAGDGGHENGHGGWDVEENTILPHQQAAGSDRGPQAEAGSAAESR